MKVFGSKAISTRQKIRLGFSLVVSKLLYNVHVWSTFLGRHRTMLNTMYMRLWRRVSSDPRFGRPCYSDLEIRKYIGVPSIDCIVRRRRLIYLSQMLRSDVLPLQALIQCRGKDNDLLPWAHMIIHDFKVLKEALPSIFQNMSDPDVFPDAFCRIARDQPRNWEKIVGRYFQLHDDYNPSETEDRADSISASACHKCDRCSRSFASSKALKAHQRKKHGDTCVVDKYIGDVSVCPVCGSDFNSRVRLTTHLSDSRVRSKTRMTSCHAVFLASNPSLISQNVLERCRLRDRCIRAEARKQGRTHEIASVPCKRARTSIADHDPVIARGELPKRRRLNRKSAPEALFKMGL